MASTDSAVIDISDILESKQDNDRDIGLAEFLSEKGFFRTDDQMEFFREMFSVTDFPSFLALEATSKQKQQFDFYVKHDVPEGAHYVVRCGANERGGAIITCKNPDEVYQALFSLAEKYPNAVADIEFMNAARFYVGILREIQ